MWVESSMNRPVSAGTMEKSHRSSTAVPGERELTKVARPEVCRRDRYEATHDVEAFIVPLLRAWVEDQLRKCLDKPGPQVRVIDVGCGRQPFRALIESLGARYSSCDAIESSGQRPDFIAPIDQELPQALLAMGPFDLALCTEVLEHVSDWASAFKNLSELVERGGKLLVTCPHFYPLHEQPYDFWRATPHAIRFWATRHGFEVLELDSVGSAWEVLGTLLGGVMAVPRAPTISNRIAGRFARLLIRSVMRALRSGRVQARLNLTGTALPASYLSNVAVLVRT